MTIDNPTVKHKVFVTEFKQFSKKPYFSLDDVLKHLFLNLRITYAN